MIYVYIMKSNTHHLTAGIVMLFFCQCVTYSKLDEIQTKQPKSLKPKKV